MQGNAVEPTTVTGLKLSVLINQFGADIIHRQRAGRTFRPKAGQQNGVYHSSKVHSFHSGDTSLLP
jgi:hypothetical protein